MLLKDSMVMYCIYNAETLEKLIDMVHHMYNITSPNEKLFTGQLNTAYMWYINTHGTQGIQHYAINSLLYLRTIREKYIQMYKEYIMQLHMYAKVIRRKMLPAYFACNSSEIKRDSKCSKNNDEKNKSRL